MTAQQSITPMEYWNDHAREDNSMLIDVSDPGDFEQLHAAGSNCIALKDTRSLAQQARAANIKLYMISRQGQVAAAVRSELQRDGIDNVVNINGGTEAWAASGLPVCRAAPYREMLFGLLEATILIGTTVAAVIFPSLVMLVILAAAGFAIVALAIWDDRLATKPRRSRVVRSG